MEKIMVIHEIPNYIRVSYDESKDYVLYDWSDFQITLDQIKIAFEKALAMAKLKRCYYFVAETSKVRTILRPEVLKWWGETWMPKVEEAKIRAVVTVVPPTAVARLSNRSWQAEVVGSITMKNVSTLIEAEAFIKEMKQTRPI
jgi:hypothetical protein